MALSRILALMAQSSSFGTALDPSAAGAIATLSNSNRRATGSGSLQWYGARSVTSRVSGKVYIEATIVSEVTAGDVGFGIVPSTASMGSSAWFAGDSFVLLSNATSANIEVDNAVVGHTGSTWVTGQTACIAVDIDARLIWARSNGGNWNNSGTANPATGVGGIDLGASARPLYLAVDVWRTASIDVNFGQSAFVYTPPSGFQSP